MTNQQCPEENKTIMSTYRCTPDKPTSETDEEYLYRQFRLCITALERVHALSPGEFEQLVQTPVHTEEEFKQRAQHHEEIARHAFLAAQRGLLAEEEFNIWSGRRKENGQPVKFRFERAYSVACNPYISCMRGALTGIVRAYVRLQDEVIASLISKAEQATTAEELYAVELDATNYGFLEFEPYACGNIAGWPFFPRSTGRFRGATRLRQYFEQRQEQLPMAEDLAETLLQRLATEYPTTPSLGSEIKESSAPMYDGKEQKHTSIERIFAKISKIFR